LSRSEVSTPGYVSVTSSIQMTVMLLAVLTRVSWQWPWLSDVVCIYYQVMSRCEKHDLEIGSCADCRPRPGQARVTAGEPRAGEAGNWFIAGFGGTCSGCGEDIEPGAEIRADGQGGWERRECCGEYETAPRVIRDPVRLVSWGLDPGHPGYPNLTRPPSRRSP
jgi:hypothetical protein